MSARREAWLRAVVLAMALLAGAGAAGVLVSAKDSAIFFGINGALAALPSPLLPLLSMLGLGTSAMLVLSPALLIAPRVVGASLVALPLGLLLTHVPKNLLQIPRPLAVLDAAQVHVIGSLLRGANSMPSGHAVTALSVATVLVLGARSLQRRPVQGFAILGVALAVCVARIAVGAHWPSDVMAGAALGLLNGWCAAWIADRWQVADRPGCHAIFALIVLGCAFDLARSDAVLPEALLPRLLLVLLGVASVAGWCLATARRFVLRRDAPVVRPAIEAVQDSDVTTAQAVISRAPERAAPRNAAGAGTGSTVRPRAVPVRRA